jgi:hypothetical protein
VLEPEPLRGVVELDIDSEVIRVLLELVVAVESTLLVNVETEVGERRLAGMRG